MKTRLLKNLPVLTQSLAVTVALMSASVPALSLSPVPGWKVQNGKLLDANNKPFIFRGVTIDHIRAPEQTVRALKDVAAAGANSAQIEIAIKPTPNAPYLSDVTQQIRVIVAACKEAKLVCVLEANDTAGYYASEGGLSPEYVVSFWQWPEIRDILYSAQTHVIVGISNQPLAPLFDFESYIERMRWAISEFRTTYPNLVVMVDGSNWGQDTNKAMHELAKRNLQSSNIYQNVIYSVDMFDQYVNPENVRDYIASFSSIGAPLVIGGFGPVPYYHPHFVGPLPLNAPRLPEEAVMQYAEQYGAGYFGWSWSGNKNPALDIVMDWNRDHLTAWGNTLFNSANGIKATAKPASVFANGASSQSNSSSSQPANRPPVANITYSFDYVRCGQTYGNVNASGSYDPDGDSLTYLWEISGYGGTTTSAEPTLRFYMQPPHSYTIKLTVTDEKGASATTSISRNHTNSDNCITSLSSTSSSIIRPSSSSVPSVVSSSSVRPSASSNSSRSSSSAMASGNCSYVINSQWSNGFTAAIRIKNTGAQPINGWNVNWQYSDGSKITGSWNAGLTGTNPYSAKNLNWNATIQPGQTIEFGFQGSKPNVAASVPSLTGAVCK